MATYAQLAKNHTAAMVAAAAETAVAVKPATTAEEFIGLPFQPGDKVLDKLTGQVGIVVNGTIRHELLPTA